MHNFNFLRLSLLLTISILVSPLSSGGGAKSPPAQSIIRRVVVVGGTHGNEYTGVWCIKALDKSQHTLKKSYPSLDVSTLLGNPQAHLENKRFIHSDLNREFTADKLSVGEEGLPLTVESLRAREVDTILGPKFSSSGHNTDLVIDLHSTTTNMGVTIIIPEGDVVMAQAAAHVLHECKNGETRILMHSIPKRKHRPNLSSTARHGFTIEVGPVPQGVLRHDAVEKTQRAISSLLEFLHRRNVEGEEAVVAPLLRFFPSGRIPCFRSAPAKLPGEMSGKITWPADPTNPNFPAVMVHKSLQDRDFHLIRRGDPLFVELDGTVIPYEGSHGDEVYLIFVNEGGYYYQSSGRGIGVAISTEYDLKDGMLVEERCIEGDEGCSLE